MNQIFYIDMVLFMKKFKKQGQMMKQNVYYKKNVVNFTY